MALAQDVQSTVTVTGTSQGLDQVAQKLEAINDAQQAVAQSGATVANVTDTVVRRQLSAASSWDRLRASLDPAVRAQQQFERGLTLADRALRTGAASAAEHARAVEQLNARLLAASAANENLATSHGHAASAAGLNRAQMLELGHVAKASFESIVSGAPVMTVLAQQGASAAQALSMGQGGVAGSLKAIGGAALGLVNPLTVGAASILGLGGAALYAVARWENGQNRLAASLTGLGRATETTVAGLNRVAEGSASAGHVSVGAARDMVAAYASTGRIGADVMGDLIAVTKNYAATTGQDVPEATAELAKAFADPSKGADDLNQRLGILDDATAQYVKRVALAGDRTQAQTLILNGMKPALIDAAEHTGTLARAWEWVRNAAAGAADAIGRAGAPGTLKQRADAAEKLRAQLVQQNAQQAGPTGSPLLDNPLAQGYRREGRADETAATDLANDLNEQVRRRSQLDYTRTRDAAATLKSIDVGNDVLRALEPERQQLEALTAQAKALGEALEDPLVAGKLDGGIDNARARYGELQAKVQQLAADYAKGGTAAAAALRAANFQAAIAGLNSYARGLAEINQRYEEQIRLAAGAEHGAARIAALRAAQGAEVSAYNVQSRRNAEASVATPSGFAERVLKIEGDNDNTARNPRSSAYGAGQFIRGTWIPLFREKYGDVAAQIDAAHPNDPRGADDAIAALRNQREYNLGLTNLYAQKNALALAGAGFQATDTNLYLGHFLGPQGMLKTLQADPGASAAAILGADAARANPTVIGNGHTISDVIGFAARKTQGASNAVDKLGDQTKILQDQVGLTDKSTGAMERNKAIQQALDEERQRGTEIGQQFTSAQELLRAKVSELTPEMAAQRQAILDAADAYGKASQASSNFKAMQDALRERASLGLTSDELQIQTRVRGAGLDPGSTEGRQLGDAYGLTSTLKTAKDLSGGALSGFLGDIAHGTRAADALRNAFTRVADQILKMASDGLISKLFGSLLGGGGLSLFGGGKGGGASSQMIDGTEWFANGGIMTARGSIPLSFYANGGIASTPQAAVFGEGRQPEAFVPLPDGRSIPVSMRVHSPAANANSPSMTDARSFSFDMRGSTLTEEQARAMFSQALAHYDAEKDRTSAVSQGMLRRAAF